MTPGAPRVLIGVDESLLLDVLPTSGTMAECISAGCAELILAAVDEISKTIVGALVLSPEAMLMVWVSPDSRRQKIGTLLVREAIDILRMAGMPSAPKVWRGTERAALFWATFGAQVQ